MKLIESGQPRYGIVEQPYSEINYLDFDYRDPMNNKRGVLSKKLNYNHFQYFGVISERLIFGCALVKVKIGATLFCYVYDTQSKELAEWNFKDVGLFGTNIVNTPTNGVSSFKRGKKTIRFVNQDNPREKRLVVDFPNELNIDVSFSETEPVFEPMCITTKAGVNGWVYAQKVAGVRCHGEIHCAQGHFDMDTLNAYAHHDWSGGYMRRETFWNWACLSCDVDNTRLGLNVSCGVNETSYSENCYWVNGKLVKVDLVSFDFNRDNPDSEWLIASNDGQIDLHFKPEGYHEERQNLLLIKSNFKQIFGRFNGRIGEIPIKEQYGFVEDQYVKW